MNSFLMNMAAAALIAAAFWTSGCSPGDSDQAAKSASHSNEPAAAAPTNRIDIPPAVRTNLGITFAKVERRAVASTIRVPGRFELLPTARREYRTALDGRVELLVAQFDRVSPGAALYRLDSPSWRQMQREIEDTVAAVDIARARVESLTPFKEAHQLHEKGLREAVDLWTARVEQLKDLAEIAGGRAAELAEAQSNLTEAQASFGEVKEKAAELQLKEAELRSELRAGESRLDLLLNAAATVLGVPREAVDDGGDSPMWKQAGVIEVRAVMSGAVETIASANGTWTDEGEMVLSVVDPGAIRFRAKGLQSDLRLLRDGLPASIVPPQGGSIALEDAIPTTLQIGLDADPQLRTLELLAAPTRLTQWSRAGVSAFLEIAVDQSESELAIPMSCVVRDGLTPIIFRRDPANPDKVIRLPADLGINDGRWIVINSGVKEGDEVVLDGAYQLLLASSATAQKGGHFHADGTFHAGEDE
jgi:multidrug efflux pump subunit AcrA (membrane-fusion protein)